MLLLIRTAMVKVSAVWKMINHNYQIKYDASSLSLDR
jgi:hypothetical protein